jgi:hypothetical protein
VLARKAEIERRLEEDIGLWLVLRPGLNQVESFLFRRYDGHQVDFDQDVFGQTGDLYGSACWRRGAPRCEMFRVDGIHCGEVVEVLQEHGSFDDERQTAPAGFEDRFEVGEDLRGLFSDATGHHLLGLRIQRNLARSEEQTACPDTLRIGANGSWCFVGRDDGSDGAGRCLAHAVYCNGYGDDGSIASINPRGCQATLM